MDTIEAKSTVKSYIIERVKNISKASRALLLMRTIHSVEIEDEELDIGEGNFLIAMGDFAIFEYLSMFYYGLTNNVQKWFNHEKTWKFKISADDCFSNLILNNKSGISFGIENLTPDELKRLWGDWRNKLSHMLCQKEGNSSISFQLFSLTNQRSSYLDFIQSKSVNQCAFNKNGTYWQCYIDTLNRDLDKLANWIAEDKLNIAEKDNVEKINTWLTSNFK